MSEQTITTASGWCITPADGMRHNPYRPCAVGLHVCVIFDDPDESGFQTVANIECETAAVAEALFVRAKDECEARPGEPEEMIVDLNLGIGCCETFMMSRQMLDRLTALQRGEPR